MFEVNYKLQDDPLLEKGASILEAALWLIELRMEELRAANHGLLEAQKCTVKSAHIVPVRLLHGPVLLRRLRQTSA